METQAFYEHFELFNRNRATLSSLIARQQEITGALEMQSWQTKLTQLNERVRANNFRVLVIGDFNSGKSTLINALLWDEILPTYPIPTTAIINEVKWGDEPRAVLHPVASGDTAPADPFEVSPQDLEDYVVIKDHDNVQGEIGGNPYSKVELHWPLALCRNGVEIIDSPGLNESHTRQQITTDYMAHVDAVIFVLSCDRLASKGEIEMIETLRHMGHEDIFFVCNRINMIRRRERNDVMQYGLTRLAPLTRRGADHVFFVNALGALDGRLDDIEEDVADSGIYALEAKLERFLAEERGRVKILRPATQLQRTIDEARRVIPERRSLLGMDSMELERRYAKAQQPLQELEEMRRHLIAHVQHFRQETGLRIERNALSFLREVARKVPEWIKPYEFKNPVRMNELFEKEVRERRLAEAVAECQEEVYGHYRRAFRVWQKTHLEAMVTERIEGLLVRLGKQAQAFEEVVEDVRKTLTDTDAHSSKRKGSEEKQSPLERMLTSMGAGPSVEGDFALHGVGKIGKSFFYKSMLQQATLGFIAALISAGPLLLAALPLAWWQSKKSMKVINDAIKDKVSQSYASAFQHENTATVEAVVQAVDKYIMALQQALEQGLGQEIRNVSEQVEAVLDEKRKGETMISEKMEALESVSHSLNEVDSEVNDLFALVALG